MSKIPLLGPDEVIRMMLPLKYIPDSELVQKAHGNISYRVARSVQINGGEMLTAGEGTIWLVDATNPGKLIATDENRIMGVSCYAREAIALLQGLLSGEVP